MSELPEGWERRGVNVFWRKADTSYVVRLLDKCWYGRHRTSGVFAEELTAGKFGTAAAAMQALDQEYPLAEVEK